MTVYADVLFGINALLDYLLLLGSARLGGAPIRRLRLLAAAVLGGAWAVGCAAPGLEWLRSLAMRPVVLAAMLLCAFGPHKSTLRLGVLFLALSFAFGGLVLMLMNVFGAGIVLVGGAAYYPVSGRVLVLTAAAVYVVVRAVLARLVRHTGGELVPVELTAGGRTARLTALRDTGNTLRDPVTNREVLVADWQVARALLPPPAAEGLTGELFARPADLLPRLAASATAGRWRLIPYRAVGTAGGLLLAMRCDRIRAGGQVYRGGLVAFSPTSVSDGGAYTALIGGSA